MLRLEPTILSAHRYCKRSKRLRVAQRLEVICESCLVTTSRVEYWKFWPDDLRQYWVTKNDTFTAQQMLQCYYNVKNGANLGQSSKLVSNVSTTL